MALYLIAIGGTGAKCAESIVHLAAANLFSGEPIRILFVDQDRANGNVSRSKTLVGTYQECHLLAKKSDVSWMSSEIKILGDVWAPVQEEDQTFGGVFQYDNLEQRNPKLKHLFDVLYSEEERKTPLVDGFRGHPAIGSAVMSRLDLAQDKTWQELFTQIKTDLGRYPEQPPKIFLCGSVFGGTGASGLPTLSRMIAEKLKKEGITDAKIAGLLMLPYFSFPTAQAPKEGIYANPDQFLLNTEVALRYYHTQNQKRQSKTETQENVDSLEFDAIYLLGMPELSEVSKQFKLGRATQENSQHFLELYAALAARDFLLHTPTQKVLILRREEAKTITWGDIPGREEIKKNLVQTTRFALAWTTNIYPELKKGLKNISDFAKKNPWFEKFFQSGTIFADRDLPLLSAEAQITALEKINSWSEIYLKWLMGWQQSQHPYRLRLFNPTALNLENPNFLDLVEGAAKSKGGLQYLKNRLNPGEKTEFNIGTVALAKALYELCDNSEGTKHGRK